MATTDGVVLIVDDDPQLRLVFSDYLNDQFEVRTAESEADALDKISDEIDVVLLDRMMPRMTGEETLSKLRDNEFDQPAIMVTAVEPDSDVLEVDIAEYLVKPVVEEELRDIVETVILRDEFDSIIREYFSLVSKVTALKQQKDSSELSENEESAVSKARLDEIKDEARRALDTVINAGKFDKIFQDVFQETKNPAWQTRGVGQDNSDS